ncbi:Hypothetical protein Tpal_1282 [Trichococcus palustris]|uniref:Uncharacterized protein n=1 Tax=Trichococcus palustris TaxID=140314 RepID=A0A143YJL5_9LACT|nr:Hypothetical protein Tpal_1282 [Trichococcus palustris]SFL16828.1 hypothetical protein SAMN04488076_1287 [Trichococcus palustris]
MPHTVRIDFASLDKNGKPYTCIFYHFFWRNARLGSANRGIIRRVLFEKLNSGSKIQKIDWHAANHSANTFPSSRQYFHDSNHYQGEGTF